MIPANAVTRRNNTVSHSWMLIRGRRPTPRLGKSRLDQNSEKKRKRGLLFPEGFPEYFFPLRFGRKNLFLTENIPDAPGSVDELGVPGVALNLLAEVTNVHVDRALVAELVAPHPRE